MMHGWTDDAYRIDIPPALVKLLRAIDACKFDITRIDSAGMLAIAEARREAIRALEMANLKYSETDGSVRNPSGRLVEPYASQHTRTV